MEFQDFSYNNGKTISEAKGTAEEVKEIIGKMDINSKSGREFNRFFREKLQEYDWNYKKNVISSLSIKYGFRKNRTEIETQFGNVARYYSDVFKLQLSYDKNKIHSGILILASKLLANEIGSNIANFERAKKELIESRPTYSVPLWLIGIKMKI